MSPVRPQTKESVYVYSFRFRRNEFELWMIAEELGNACTTAQHPFAPPGGFKQVVLSTVANEEIAARPQSANQFISRRSDVGGTEEILQHIHYNNQVQVRGGG